MKEQNNYLSIILKNRNMLMGLSILLVIYFHSMSRLENIIRPFGNGGVDVFLFLSGIGLYLSLDKNYDIIGFYKKRFLRLFPTYLIVITLSLPLSKYSFIEYISVVSTIGFWFGGAYFNWYMSAIVLFYLSAPFLFKLYPRRINSLVLFLGALLISLVLHKFFVQAVGRIPIFILGFIIGRIGKNIKPNQFIYIFIIMIIGLILLYSLHYDIIRINALYFDKKVYPLILIIPGACLGISLLLNKLNFKFIKSALSYIGTISYEIYLVHIVFFYNNITFSLSHGNQFVLFLVVLILSIILHYISKYIITLLSK